MKMKGIDDKILTLLFYPLKLMDMNIGNNNIKRKIIYNKNARKVLFIPPQWMGKSIFYKRLSNRLENSHTIVIYDLPNRLLNENPMEVVKYFNDIKKDIIETANFLEDQDYLDFAIFGTSLSTISALMAANSDKRFKKIVLNLTASDFAKSFWESEELLVKTIRNKMQSNNINLVMLKKYWKNLAPINNINNLNDRKLLIFLAKNDTVIPFKYGMEFLDKIKKKNIKFNLHIDNFFGHYLSGFKQLLFPDRIIRFLVN